MTQLDNKESTISQMAKQLAMHEVDKRIAAAQEIQLDFSTATTDRIRKLVITLHQSAAQKNSFFYLFKVLQHTSLVQKLAFRSTLLGKSQSYSGVW